jgi:hypothetical protein
LTGSGQMMRPRTTCAATGQVRPGTVIIGKFEGAILTEATVDIAAPLGISVHDHITQQSFG